MRLSLHRNPVAPAMKVRSHSLWRLMVHSLHTSPGYRFCSTLQGSTCPSKRIQLNTAETSFGCLSTYPSTGWSQENVLLWLVFLPLIDYVTLCRSLLLSGPLSSHLLKGALEVDQLKSSCGPNTLRAPLSAPCPVRALLLAPLCPQVFLFLPFIIKMYTSRSWAWLPFVSFLTATQT